MLNIRKPSFEALLVTGILEARDTAATGGAEEEEVSNLVQYKENEHLSFITIRHLAALSGGYLLFVDNRLIICELGTKKVWETESARTKLLISCGVLLMLMLNR